MKIISSLLFSSLFFCFMSSGYSGGQNNISNKSYRLNYYGSISMRNGRMIIRTKGRAIQGKYIINSYPIASSSTTSLKLKAEKGVYAFKVTKLTKYCGRRVSGLTSFERGNMVAVVTIKHSDEVLSIRKGPVLLSQSASGTRIIKSSYQCARRRKY